MRNVPAYPPNAPCIGAEGITSCERDASFLRYHPCFSEAAHSRYGRLHLPVAPVCNIRCNYCDRQVGDCYHTFHPGVARRVMTAKEAVTWTADALRIEPRLKVAGIAGPGEPLANEATFQTLESVGHRFPQLILCLSTNGLLLPQFAQRLASMGVQTVTVTVNALHPDVGARIYAWVTDDELSEVDTASMTQPGHVLRRGAQGATLLIRRQMEGIAAASAAGMAVKVNTVLIPDINVAEIGPIAQAAQDRGAVLHNIMPLIPLGRFRGLRPPTQEELQAARRSGHVFLPQFRSCRQCRADAIGVPGEGDRQLLARMDPGCSLVDQVYGPVVHCEGRQPC